MGLFSIKEYFFHCQNLENHFHSSEVRKLQSKEKKNSMAWIPLTFEMFLKFSSVYTCPKVSKHANVGLEVVFQMHDITPAISQKKRSHIFIKWLLFKQLTFMA